MNKAQKISTGTKILTVLFLSFSMGLWDEENSITILANQYKWIILGATPLLATMFYGVKLSTPRSPITISLAIFIISTTISTLNSPHLNDEGLKNLFAYYFIFTLCFIVPPAESHAQLQKYISRALSITSLTCIAISLPLFFSPESWGGSRFSGIYHNANGMGSIALIAFISSLFLRQDTGSNIFLISAAISLIFLIITQSRGAILSIGVCTVIYLIHQKKAPHALAAALTGLGLYWISQNIVYLGLIEDYSSRNYEFTLDIARKLILEKHIDLFLEAPIFGQGLSEGFYGGRFPAELAYTDILSFSGIVGFSFFMLALLIATIHGYKNLNKYNSYEKSNYFIFISILTLSIGDGYISNIGNPLPIFCWFYLATLYKHRNTQSIAPQQKQTIQTKNK